MSKYNYFDTLNRLAQLSSRAVFLACSPPKETVQGEISALRQTSDRLLCELEGVLFSDFMPPIERAGIASCAHSFARIIERCLQISNYRLTKNVFGERKNREAELCIRLSQLIEDAVSELKRIKSPRELPDIVGFRKTMCEARNAHSVMQKKLNSGLFPRSAQHTLCLMAQLRGELGICFDTVIETMLDNI